ncbi:unnamed protein product, partial [marine sediment metagenome]
RITRVPTLARANEIYALMNDNISQPRYMRAYTPYV